MVEKSQRRMNATTAGNRAWFAAHRQRIEVLLRKNPRGARLCVLGAGNCNDLDLPELAGHFGEIHLVDLDATATRNATRPLGLANLIVHAPLDITGIAAILSTWGMPRPTDAAITHAIQLAEPGEAAFMDGGLVSECRKPRQDTSATNDSMTPFTLRDLAGTFDVVLSPCVLSQLLVSAREALGHQHPRYPQLRRAIQLGHARLITRLLRPGGRGVMLVDAVSSERAERLAQLGSGEERQALAEWIEQGLHFPGLEPATIARVVSEAAPGAAVELDTDRPWVWRLGERKAFVVYACQWTRQNAQAIVHHA